jgi:ubiquinone biosynthesis protein Coq4
MKEEPKQEEKKLKVQIAKKLSESKSVGCFIQDLKHKSKTIDTTPMKLVEHDLEYLGLVGQGTFGKVFRAKMKKNNLIVAVKKVFQDPKYKNREFEIVSMLQS